MKTIGVAVPCFYGHINKLPALLASIEKQTIHPKKVAISCSSSLPKDIPHFGPFSFELQFVVTSERKNAAENRNIAVKYLDTDLVSFIDADDVMHPQRLEALQQLDADMIVHDFVCSNSYTFETCSSIVGEYDTLRLSNGRVVHTDNKQFAGAHVTVSSNVLKTMKFDESKDSELCADSKFCFDAISAGFKSAYIPQVLSKGDASFTCFLEQGIPVVLTYADQTTDINPPPKPKRFGIGSLMSR